MAEATLAETETKLKELRKFNEMLATNLTTMEAEASLARLQPSSVL